MSRFRLISRMLLSTGALAAALLAIPPAAGAATVPPRAVYTQTNAPEGNAVVWFTRSSTGRLKWADFYSTGGTGSPNYHSGFAVTDSQGSLAVNPQKTLLFAVNHGSNSVTSFRIRRSGALNRVHVVPSGGRGPSSLAIRKDGVLYVSNEGTPAKIRGFKVSRTGRMRPIAGSTKTLAHPESSPGQVGFDRSGRYLVVTDRFVGATNEEQDFFEVFRVSDSGRPTALPPVPSAAQEPYAFAFTSRNVMLVADAENLDLNASSTSSYTLGGQGGLTHVTTKANGQTSSCWVVITEDSRHAFMTGGGNPSVLGFTLSPGGDFSVAGPAEGVPIGGLGGDVALARGSKFLYVLNVDASIFSGDLTARSDIDAFRVNADGTLTPLGTFGSRRLLFSGSGLIAL
jgi:6-phosphogluconolactonase